jgi:hypothetical protein
MTVGVDRGKWEWSIGQNIRMEWRRCTAWMYALARGLDLTVSLALLALSGVGRTPRAEKIFLLLWVRSVQPIRYCANKETTWT